MFQESSRNVAKNDSNLNNRCQTCERNVRETLNYFYDTESDASSHDYGLGRETFKALNIILVLFMNNDAKIYKDKRTTE